MMKQTLYKSYKTLVDTYIYMYIVYSLIYIHVIPQKNTAKNQGQLVDLTHEMLPLNRENPTKKNEVFPMVGGSKQMSTELAGFLEINGHGAQYGF